jgi:hypothetical protein
VAPTQPTRQDVGALHGVVHTDAEQSVPGLVDVQSSDVAATMNSGFPNLAAQLATQQTEQKVRVRLHTNLKGEGST